MIKHEGSKYNVYSEDGSKHLGSYATEAEAKKRLQEIEMWKHIKKASGG